MAKSVTSTKSKSAYAYPSRFGTHKSMLVSEPDSNGFVKAKDEYGEYTTHISKVDNNQIDWNRVNYRRIKQ